MSANSVRNKLQKFLTKTDTDCQVPHLWTHRDPIILTDSKGRYCFKTTSNVNGEYLPTWWYRSGRTSAAGVKLIEKKIHKFDKPVHLYVWLGTCDLTVKTGRFLELKTRSNAAVDAVLENFNEILALLDGKNCIVTFLQCPIYSIAAYNQKKGHPHSESYISKDVTLKNQIHFLNHNIRLLNDSLNTHSPCFTVLLYTSKKLNNKYISRYCYELYKDGIHPENLLARVWQQMIVRQIVKDCY